MAYGERWEDRLSPSGNSLELMISYPNQEPGNKSISHCLRLFDTFISLHPSIPNLTGEYYRRAKCSSKINESYLSLSIAYLNIVVP